MKEIQLNVDSIIVEKICQLSRNGVIPKEYTEGFSDYETTLSNDGKARVKLIETSYPLQINPLELDSVKKVLVKHNLAEDKIKIGDCYVYKEGENYCVKIAVYTGTRNCMLHHTSLTYFPRMSNDDRIAYFGSQRTIIYAPNSKNESLVFLHNKKYKPIYPYCGNDREIYKSLEETFKSIELDTARPATQQELDLIDSLYESDKYDTYDTEEISFTIPELEAELHDKNVMKEQFLASPAAKDFIPYLNGEYTPMLQQFDYWLGFIMCKSMELDVVDFKDEKFIKNIIDNIGELSFDACKKFGITIEAVVKEDPHVNDPIYNNYEAKTKSDENGKINGVFLQIGLTDKQLQILDMIKSLLDSLNKRKEAHKWSTGADHIFSSWGGIWPRGYGREAATLDGIIHKLDIFCYENADDYKKLRFVMSDSLNEYIESLIKQNELPSRLSVNFKDNIFQTGKTFFVAEPKTNPDNNDSLKPAV